MSNKKRSETVCAIVIGLSIAALFTIAILSVALVFEVNAKQKAIKTTYDCKASYEQLDEANRLLLEGYLE